MPIAESDRNQDLCAFPVELFLGILYPLQCEINRRVVVLSGTAGFLPAAGEQGLCEVFQIGEITR